MPFGSQLSQTQAVLYVDGKPVITAENFGAINPIPMMTAPNMQGMIRLMEFGQDFHGRCDDIRVWTRAITPQEIKREIEVTLPPGHARDLILHCPMSKVFENPQRRNRFGPFGSFPMRPISFQKFGLQVFGSASLGRSTRSSA